MGDDYGSVDLFGLDEFGQAVGGPAMPAIGAALGAGTQAGTAWAVRAMTDMDKYAEAIGMGVGVVAGGAMLMIPTARTAAWAAIAASLVGGGIRQLEQMVSKKEAVKQDAVKTTTPTKGWGIAAIEPSWSAYPGELTPPGGMNGQMGYPTVSDQFIVPGSMGPGSTSQFEGHLGMPPQLVGAGDYGLSQNPAAQQASLVGPGVSGLGSHYGSTIFG